MKHRHKKASGGKIMDAGGNPEVEKEAEERKHGGRAHTKAEGGKPKHRLDKYRRGGRAMGGSAGADKHPLSSSSKVRHVGSTAGVN